MNSSKTLSGYGMLNRGRNFAAHALLMLLYTERSTVGMQTDVRAKLHSKLVI